MNMKKISVVISFFCIVTYSLQLPVYALPKRQVLGIKTVLFPAIPAAPGMFLPDSSLYILDILFKELSIALAPALPQKAQIMAEASQERLAEAGIMLKRQNPRGTGVALTAMADEVMGAVMQLKKAKAQGEDVTKPIFSLNEQIKSQRFLLRQVSEQTDGSSKAQLELARQRLDEAKIVLEEELPDDVLQKELQLVANEKIDEIVAGTTDDTIVLDAYVQSLKNEMDASAKQSLLHRQQAVKEVLEETNARVSQEKLRIIAEEQKKEVAEMERKMEAADLAKKSVQEARDAAILFKEAQKAAQQRAAQLPI